MARAELRHVDDEIELNVIAAAITAREARLHVAAALAREDFYREAHRLIFDVIADLNIAPEGVVGDDLLVDELRRRGNLESIGGASYVGNLPELPDVASIEERCKRLRELRTAREVDALCVEIHAQADPARKLELLENGATRIHEGDAGDECRTLGEIAHEWRPQAMASAVASGLPSLDRALRVSLGNLVVIAGTPGSGKTSLMLQIGRHVAESAPVLFASGEMSAAEVYTRALTMEAQLSTADALSPPNERVRGRVETARRRLDSLPLRVFRGRFSPGAIAARARLERLRNRSLGLIAIDYLQLVDLSLGRGVNLAQALGQVTRDFKRLAQELEVPILLGSQLSRGHRHEKRMPNLHDLRDSGSIESDADNVVILARTEEHDEPTPEVVVLIRKARMADRGKLRLRFGKGARFDEWDGDAPW